LGSFDVIKVDTEKDLETFLRFPFNLYLNDKNYVPPLLSEQRKHFSKQNPFFKHAKVDLFIVKDKDKVVGRIAGIVNRRHIEFHYERAGFFGFFESINDQRVANILLDNVTNLLKDEGMEIIRGPMNFSTNEECGFLLEGFNEPPMIMTPYNFPYYHALMEGYGMSKAKDLSAFVLDIPKILPDKIERTSELAKRIGIRARHIDIKRFDDEMNKFKEIYNSAWERNWGFIPLTDEELSYLGNNLKKVLDPDLIIIAEKGDEPIGVLGLLPDYNFVLKYMNGKLNLFSILKAIYYSKKIKDLRLLLLGIKQKYRNKGVDALLYKEAHKNAIKKNFQRVEFSWILEDNLQTIRLVEMIGGRLYKRYRIYQKLL
jgi:hypothetical protein